MQPIFQIIEIFFTIVIILLILRLLFAITGSTSHPIVSAIFSFTEPIVRPFRGMIHAARPEIVATLVALIAVLIVRYIVIELIGAFVPHGRGN